jgi:lipopolysaccharide transport system ATP-binding protein
MSSEPSITVDNLGKRYRIVPTKWNGRFADAQPEAMEGEHFWALRNVSFSLGGGETLGLIGRNGAGKSTLLRILGQITDPTEGRATIHGRVGSLLEVGAGFHPEITGRENIAMMGAILGMRRREIQAHFDEIVAFAEVAPFIDTPVKYYSSGMYLRLAFAVAAHLDAEVLLLDEALAVGDQRFRERSLTKIRELASTGRTVIFVSHDATSMAKLCDRALLIENGRVLVDGAINDVMQQYRDLLEPATVIQIVDDAPDTKAHVTSVTRLDAAGETRPVGAPLELEVALHVPADAPEGLNLLVELVGIDLWPVTGSGTAVEADPAGHRVVRCALPTLRLAPSRYTVSVTLRQWDRPIQSLAQLCAFEVIDATASIPSWTWRYIEDAEWSDASPAASQLPDQPSRHTAD